MIELSGLSRLERRYDGPIPTAELALLYASNLQMSRATWRAVARRFRYEVAWATRTLRRHPNHAPAKAALTYYREAHRRAVRALAGMIDF